MSARKSSRTPKPPKQQPDASDRRMEIAILAGRVHTLATVLAVTCQPLTPKAPPSRRAVRAIEDLAELLVEKTDALLSLVTK